jgi:hypothetical protein
VLFAIRFLTVSRVSVRMFFETGRKSLAAVTRDCFLSLVVKGHLSQPISRERYSPVTETNDGALSVVV